MFLSKIINKEIELLKTVENNPKVTGVDFDSKKIKQGMIFAAIEGLNYNGINFCDQAIEAGATTILCKKNIQRKY